MKTEEILNEREKTHGNFEETAEFRQALTGIWAIHSQQKTNDAQTFALSMIFTKIARIVCGDPNHADHWDDIAGYAMLGKGKEEREEHERVEIKGDEGKWKRLEKCLCIRCGEPYLGIPMVKGLCCVCLNKKEAQENEARDNLKPSKAFNMWDAFEWCDYDPENCRICKEEMTPWSNKTWKLHKAEKIEDKKEDLIAPGQDCGHNEPIKPYFTTKKFNISCPACGFALVQEIEKEKEEEKEKSIFCSESCCKSYVVDGYNDDCPNCVYTQLNEGIVFNLPCSYHLEKYKNEKEHQKKMAASAEAIAWIIKRVDKSQE